MTAPLLPLADALATLQAAVSALPAETVPLAALNGRHAAQNLVAAVTQPPWPASAMDGFAVRLADATPGAVLDLVGIAPAGRPADVAVGPGQAVRVFTGAPIPDGADHVVIQEDTSHSSSTVTISVAQTGPRHIRGAGVDFHAGDVLVSRGSRLGPAHVALLAAGNCTSASVHRQPRVVLFTAGDELVEPGSQLAPGQVVNANHHALTGLVAAWGGTATYLGCAPDQQEAITALFRQAVAAADLVVTVGGASVGDHDHMRPAFLAAGGRMAFSKVALRPGKPTWFGHLGELPVLGLPGNPTSALVTATLFLQPLVRQLAGAAPGPWPATAPALLAAPLAANGPRETWWRGICTVAADGSRRVAVLPRQDSSLLSTLASANALVQVPANTPAQPAGTLVPVLPLG